MESTAQLSVSTSDVSQDGPRDGKRLTARSSSLSSNSPIILHVLCVAFHHRNGPQVEYAYPSFPPLKEKPRKTSSREDDLAIELPDEWSFLPFLCLPDGAHATDEEFIYFHLPPVPEWHNYPQSTLFGLACYRQIAATELINKTSDVTRSTVQKAVVVIATQPVLGSVRTKLGLVTQAFFAQKDFSKLEILETLYQNLVSSVTGFIPDSVFYMGISLRELIFKFRQKTLVLFKLLFLEKRILFFGQKVERLSAYQYSLISLIPDLLRNLQDAGSPKLGNSPPASMPEPDVTASRESLNGSRRLRQIGAPLPMFGECAFFQPYIPLQQMDVLMSQDTKAFIVGTSNSIFLHHKTLAVDVIANVDTGAVEILNPALNSILNLTSPDKKFIDDITRVVLATYSQEDDMSMSQQLEFEGSDDDIRSRFEMYILSMLASVRISQTASISVDPNVRGKDFLADYNPAWIKGWQSTIHYSKWLAANGGDLPDTSDINPAHPCQGTSAFGILQTSLAARFSDFGRSLSPVQHNVSKAVESSISRAETQISKAVEIATDPVQQQKLQAGASQIFNNVTGYIAQKRKDWATGSPSGSSGRVTPEEGGEQNWEEVDINEGPSNSNSQPAFFGLNTAGGWTSFLYYKENFGRSGT
ncbi:transport protein Avl9-domain-containing protein [Fimicolochytrium jonesii]|uniref:transport protein Avl9-domain-containing protein n=1 Tax=Fimicolochytrium jonesii TaxID=1396493 RepID=UPI0022FEA594|nr:transport protein Avl9-domain-containing protein [Fimicolochytrium jonesii]KAI8826613.1 transport protein Avl9-domain-containing protein [Fimicolochytrium jonesii]